MSRSPKDQVFCSAANQTCPGTNLVQICHPVHHPGLAAGLKVAGDGVLSSFIFSVPLWGGRVKVFLNDTARKPLGDPPLMGPQQAEPSTGPVAEEQGKEELEKNPCPILYLPGLPPGTCACLSPGPSQIPHHWDLPHQWREGEEVPGALALGGGTHSSDGFWGTVPSPGLQRCTL